MDFSMPFSILIGAIGIYFIVIAVLGKGKAYQMNIIIEENKEEYLKISRIFYGIGGVLAIAMAILGYFGLLFWSIICFAAIFVLMIVMQKKTKAFIKPEEKRN